MVAQASNVSKILAIQSGSARIPRHPMPIQRLLKIVLIAIAVASGFSSCCSLNRQLAAYGIGPAAPMDVDPPINGDLTHRFALSNYDCD
jgi:hypothetical protein